VVAQVAKRMVANYLLRVQSLVRFLGVGRQQDLLAQAAEIAYVAAKAAEVRLLRQILVAVLGWQLHSIEETRAQFRFLVPRDESRLRGSRLHP